MSRVFVSKSTGASVYVFSNDHCPPHVSAKHRSEEWIARVRFSFLDQRVELWSVEPIKNQPARSSIHQLLEEIQAQLLECRRSWWMAQGTVCLVNQTIGRKRIIEATYEIDSDLLKLKFSDGTTEERAGT